MSPISSPITTRPPQISFARDFVNPHQGIYITPEDRLYAFVASYFTYETFTVQMRVLAPDGKVYRYEVTDQTGGWERTPAFASWPLPEGFLLGLSGGATTRTEQRGQTWMELGLLRGGDFFDGISVPLVSNYVSRGYRIGWPRGALTDPFEGRGHVYTIYGTTPGAGQRWSEAVPLGAKWRPIECTFRIQTYPVAADRRVYMAYQSPGGDTMRSGYLQNLGSNDNFDFSAFSCAQPYRWRDVSPQQFTIPLPCDSYLNYGDEIEGRCYGMHAGDQFKYIVLKVEEWLTIPW